MNFFTNCSGCSWSAEASPRFTQAECREMLRLAVWEVLLHLKRDAQGCLSCWVSYTAHVRSCARSEMLFQLSCCSVGGSFTADGVLSPSEDAHEEVCAQIVLWKERGEVREGRQEQSSSKKLRQWLYVASLRAVGKPWWGPPWRRGERPMVKGEGRRGLNVLRVFQTGSWGMSSSDPSWVCNPMAWCCGNRREATDSTLSVNSWQKIRWTGSGSHL